MLEDVELLLQGELTVKGDHGTSFQTAVSQQGRVREGFPTMALGLCRALLSVGSSLEAGLQRASVGFGPPRPSHPQHDISVLSPRWQRG